MEEVLHIVVEGRVQAVGFRFHTERVANRLGAAGWVRNRPGGDVEILVRLPASAKQEFLRAVKSGPPASKVTGLRISPLKAGLVCPEDGFVILP